MIDQQRVLNGYIECALWSSTDEYGEPLDAVFGVGDLHESTVRRFSEDIADFVRANEQTLTTSALTAEQVGHDFWLTRNSHGAGFWDRGLGRVGEELTAAAKVYGSCDLEVGDDGWIYAT